MGTYSYSDSVVVANGAWDSEPDDDVFYEDPNDVIGPDIDGSPDSAVAPSGSTADEKPDRCLTP